MLCRVCYDQAKYNETHVPKPVARNHPLSLKTYKRIYHTHFRSRIEFFFGDETTFFETLKSVRSFTKWDKPRRREISRQTALKIRDQLQQKVANQSVETLFSTYQSLNQWDFQRKELWLDNFNLRRRSRLRFIYGVRGPAVPTSQRVRKALSEKGSVRSSSLVETHNRQWSRQGKLAWRNPSQVILERVNEL